MSGASSIRALPSGLLRLAAPRFDRQAGAYALSNLVAVLLALFVAFSLDLARPFWAMLTVFIVAQPFSGSVRSRAAYRVMGTLAGAVFAVIVTPALSPSPELLCLALAAWLGVCLFLSLLDRSPRSYVFMLAGYTATIIAFSNVEAPGQIFDTALARVEEITVGILCASLAHAVLWPREVSAALKARTARALGDADRWLADVLAGRQEVPAERRRLAGEIADLELLSHHLDFDTARIRPDRASVRALLDRLSALPPLAAGLQDRLGTLRSGSVDPRFEALAAEAEAWLRAGGADAPAVLRLRAQAEALEAEHQAGLPDWRALTLASAAGRLADLLATVEESRRLADRLARGERSPRTLRATLAGPPRRPLHRDIGLAALSGVVSAVSFLLACAIWILGAWPEGGAAATFAGIGCCLFATHDDPTAQVGTMSLYIGLGAVLAGAYQFAILPAIDGFVMLAAVLAPAVLAVSYVQAKPAHNLRALALALGFAGGISLQSRYSADFTAYLNGNLAMVIGLLFALVVQRLVRVVDAAWNGRRIARRGWRQVAALARASTPADRLEWLSHALDRLGLIGARLPHGEGEALRDLQVGLDVIDLQHLRRDAPPALRRRLDDLLSALAQAFGRGRTQAIPETLAPAIDRALTACIAEAEGEPRRIGLAALVGLRRGLFPAGPAFQGEPA